MMSPGAAWTQQETSPIPLWPGEAAAPAQAADRYVFFDPPNAQLVLTATPRSGLETEVIEALQLSMQ